MLEFDVENADEGECFYLTAKGLPLEFRMIVDEIREDWTEEIGNFLKALHSKGTANFQLERKKDFRCRFYTTYGTTIFSIQTNGAIECLMRVDIPNEQCIQAFTELKEWFSKRDE